MFILFLLLFGNLLFAEQVFEDVIYLKNGSVVKGTIKELKPNESVKIETKDGSLFVFKMTEVDKIKKEPVEGRAMQYTATRESEVKEEESSLALRIGLWAIHNSYIATESDFSFYGQSFELLLGLTVVGFGFGIGDEFWPDARGMPLYGTLRLILPLGHNSGISGFFNVGYDFRYMGVDDEEHGGFIFAVGLGSKFGVSKHVSFVHQFGYRYQKAEFLKLYYSYWSDMWYFYFSEENLNLFTHSLSVMLEF